jgi:MATE family multidrug resistance protein
MICEATSAMNTDSRSPVRVLLSLAWPVVLARATQSVIGFADALMVAPLGEHALAAVTTGALDVFCLVMLPMGTAFILQSFAAQLRGAGELESLRRYAYYGLMLALLAGLMSMAMIPWIAPILNWLGFDAAVSRDMDTYVSIRLFSVAAIVGVEALGNWYGGLGNTRMAMIAGVTTMIVNILGNALLIEPRWGLPGYGVAGAAWASTIASYLGFALILVMWRLGHGIDLPRAPTGGLKIREFGRMLRFGLPNGVNWFLEFGAFAFFINVAVAHLGTTALAAFNVVIQLNSVAFMPAFGLASAGAILVGQAVGERNLQSVSGLVRITLTVVATWMIGVSLVYVIMPELLLGLFSPHETLDPHWIELGSEMLLYCVAWQLFDATALTFGEALRATGDTTWPMVVRVAIGWLGFVPASVLAVRSEQGGVAAVMTCLVIYVVLIAVALVYRFASGRWRTISMIERTASAPVST